MRSFFEFMLAALAIFSLVPLSIWAMTGKLRDAWEAARGYALCLLLVLVLPAAVGWVLALLGMAFT